MKTLSIPLLLGVLLATGPVCAQENISKVNGSISADAGQRYGKLDTVNGGIRVGEGVETGSIDTVNGGVKVADRARTGKIETVNGGVRLGRVAQRVDERPDAEHGEGDVDGGVDEPGDDEHPVSIGSLRSPVVRSGILVDASTLDRAH